MKNQGISLITLIITIIVIIILAAIVIFTGLGTPDSANFAHFCQDCDNVYSAVFNSFADLKASHATANQQRTDEQIYIEIATGTDFGQYVAMGGTTVVDKSGESQNTTTNCQNIIVTGHKDLQWGGIDGAYKSIATIEDDKKTTTKLSIKLPDVRENNCAWYITKNGQVFNATGYVYKVDGTEYTYFNANARCKAGENGPLPAVNNDLELDRAKVIATAIVGEAITGDNPVAVQTDLTNLSVTDTNS